MPFSLAPRMNATISVSIASYSATKSLTEVSEVIVSPLILSPRRLSASIRAARTAISRPRPVQWAIQYVLAEPVR